MSGFQKKLTRRQFLTLLGGSGLATVGCSIGLYSALTEPYQVEVQQVALSLPRLQPGLNGFRLVQVSDLHLDDWMTGERLDQLLAPVYQLQPDVLAITGDFITASELKPRHLGELEDVLRSLTRQMTVLAVSGNHDVWAGGKEVSRVLAACGVKELKNSAITLSRGGDDLHFAGVGDVWTGQDRLEDTLAAVPASGAAILMVHEPDYAQKSASGRRFDLQISGHSHGGQVILPLIGPPVLPWLGRRFPLGLKRAGQMWVYTNRGLGASFPQVRFHCPPEITVFTLSSAA